MENFASDLCGTPIVTFTCTLSYVYNSCKTKYIYMYQSGKRSAGSGASALVGGIATNKITTFLVEAEAVEAALKS